jgi:hypothetical protein
MNKKYLFISLIFFVLVSAVISNISIISAIGITPGRSTLDYTPGVDIEKTIQVLNSEHENLEVAMMIQGELNQSIQISEGKLEFLPSEESKSFTFKINSPVGLDPGLHSAEILAVEIPKSGSGYVGATVAVATQIHINVPYPGKYLDADFNILDAEPETAATLIVPVINRGKLGIGSAHANIEIYNLDYEKKAEVTTDFLEIGPGLRSELSAKWNISVNSGNYIARITLTYDGETRTFEKEFAIGNRKLEIESILVNNFQLGGIAKLQILVENKWNKEIKGVYANLLVYNNEGQIMTDVKSAAEDIPELSKKTLLAYWDTIGVREGEYNGKLLVYYDDKTSDKNLVLKVSEDNLDVVGVGYAINPGGGSGTSITTILLILVILLLVVNLAWFVFFKRIMNMKKKK